MVFALSCLCSPALWAQSTALAQRSPDLNATTEPTDLQTGISLTRQGRFKEAIPHLLAARDQGDRSFAVQFDLALCYVGTAQYQPAVKILNDLAPHYSSNANVFSLLAQAYVGGDQIPEAIDALHKAAVLAPRNEKLYVMLGDACMDRAQYSLGLDVANLGLKNLPNSPGLLYQRGMFLTLLDQFDTGKVDLERAAVLGKGSEIAFLAAAQKASFEGNMPELVRISREGLKKHDNEALYAMLGQALIRTGVKPGQPEFAEAVIALEKSVALRSDIAGTRIALAKLYLMTSRLPEAIAQLEAARDLDPANPAVYSQLAKAYQRNGDQARAQEMLAVLSKLNLQQAENIRSAPGERKSSYLGSRSDTIEHSPRPATKNPGEDQ